MLRRDHARQGRGHQPLKTGPSAPALVGPRSLLDLLQHRRRWFKQFHFKELTYHDVGMNLVNILSVKIAPKHHRFAKMLREKRHQRCKKAVSEYQHPGQMIVIYFVDERRMIII